MRLATEVRGIRVHPFVHVIYDIAHVLAVNLGAVGDNLIKVAGSFQLALGESKLRYSFHEQ
jgi:hypothetical protein